MNLNLQGKKALVCGSSKGIGKAIAIELASLGCEVILQARTESTLQQTLSELPQPINQQHTYLVSDFSSPDHHLHKMKTIVSLQNPIHIVVLNSGGPPSGTLYEQPSNSFHQAFHQHFFLNHELTQLLLPGMRQEGYGRILCVLSTSVKAPLPQLGVSNSTRAAVASWAKTLSQEVASWGVTVNCLLPGATRTERLQELIEKKAIKEQRSYADEEKRWLEQIPSKRFADPLEVGQVGAFLCTPAASYVNGIALCVDGGRTPGL
jgi:3-oxoacyl-[acyl-carrier protein] reductase